MLCYHWFFHPIPCVYIITFSSISSILSTAFLFLWMLHSYYLSFFLCGCWCLESLLIKFLCIKDNNSLLVAIISSFCHLSFFKYSYGVNLSFKIRGFCGCFFFLFLIFYFLSQSISFMELKYFFYFSSIKRITLPLSFQDFKLLKSFPHSQCTEEFSNVFFWYYTKSFYSIMSDKLGFFAWKKVSSGLNLPPVAVSFLCCCEP